MRCPEEGAPARELVVDLSLSSHYFLLTDQSNSFYSHRHEKTKAVVKLQKKGGGAPAREPVVDLSLSSHYFID